MKKTAWFAILLFTAVSLFAFNPEEYDLFNDVDAGGRDYLLQSVDRGFKTKTESDLKVVCSALKRIGELKLTNQAVREKVVSLVDSIDPNLNTDIQKTTFMKPAYYMGIIIMGHIGSKAEAERLAVYISNTKDRIARMYLIQSIGNLPYPISLQILHEQTEMINNTEVQLAFYLLEALKRQGYKSSIPYIRDMQLRGNFYSGDIMKRFKTAIEYLDKNGKD